MVLRKIKQERWFIEADAELPADPLADLQTAENALSLWALEDDLSNLPDIIAGIAARSMKVSKIDVAMLDDGAIIGLGLRIDVTPGKTPVASARGYHRDIVNLTAQDIIQIAEVLRRDEFRTLRFFSPQEIRELVAQAIQDRRLAATDLQKHFREDLEKHDLI